MSNYFSRYCALISSAEQLDYCRQANTLAELLACIRILWDCHGIDDNKLLNEILSLNQKPITTATVTLAGVWLPYRYQAKQGLVNWLLPVGHATQPFFDEYISHCRQQLLNQIIQPCTSLAVAQQQANNINHIQPAGFIFHLSRCGSTLISGCLSELESTCVFSESPLLTELLLDGNLSVDEQQKFLITFINLQSAAFPQRPDMIIKWNAWDIFRWDLIRSLYPHTPVIFLVRDPVEILASHHRSAGRHMAGDQVLENFHPLFANWSSNESVLGKRVKVLEGLMSAMQGCDLGSVIRIIDYQQLDCQLMDTVEFLGGSIDENNRLEIQKRISYHSKNPAQVFVADSEKKKNNFDREDQEIVLEKLLLIYKKLICFAHNS